jgi:hypothetical protein
MNDHSIPTLAAIDLILHEAGRANGAQQTCKRCGADLARPPFPALPEGAIVELTESGRFIYQKQLPAPYRMCRDA